MDEEVAAELAFHLEMKMKDLIARGMSESGARAEAQRTFGNRDEVDATCRRLARERDQRRSRAEYLQELRQDSTFALRQLGRSKLFTAIAVCTLALGVGGAACIFSIVDAVVLRPLPFAHPERIVTMSPAKMGVETAASGAEFTAFRGLSGIFDYVSAAIAGYGFTFDRAAEPVVISGGKVSADFLKVYGVRPVLGRGFVASDDEPGAPHVVVLSHRMWARDFQSDSAVLGRPITLNGEKYTVIGVMPSSFDLLRDGDELWTPLQLTKAELAQYGSDYLGLIGRLKAGVTISEAAAAMRAAEHTLASSNADVRTGNAVSIEQFRDELVGNYRRRLFVLLGAVGLVLLIACVNVANLLLARGSVRAKELAIRAALGAGRARLVRQLLAESAVLALVGTALGIGVAFALVKGLVAIAPTDVPRLEQAGINGPVLGFMVAVAVVTSVLIGVLPALRGARSALRPNLGEGGRWSSGSSVDGVRNTLVAAEVALAITLLSGSGLLIRSVWNAQHVDPGFSTHNVFAARLLLPATQYPDSTRVIDAYHRIADAVARVPGVRSSALTSIVPLSNEGHMSTSVDVEGSARPDGQRMSAGFRLISPNYLATIGIPLLSGRDIRSTDAADAPNVALVSKSLANKLWPGQNPIGKRLDALRFHEGPNLISVVGVVGDVHDVSLTQPAAPTLYVPYTQTPGALWPAIQRSLVVVARTTQDAGTMSKPIHRAVMTVDPSLPFASSHTLDEFVASSLATERFNTLLLLTLGAVALILASVGIYGVVSYFVSQRTQEIGVRTALGALPRHIWRLVLGRGLAPIGFGAVIGVALSLATARLLREQLFGVAPSDPLTLIGVVALLTVSAVMATLQPARRAMRVAPIVALHE